MGMTLSIRSLTPEDAAAVERLYQQSAAYLRSLGDETDFRFSAQVYRRDGFGAKATFCGIGAVLNDQLVGYLLYTFGYDTDRAVRYLFVLDLLVEEQVRKQGIGKALMNEATLLCRAAGGSELFWLVYDKNEGAKRFYRKLGAEEVGDLQPMHLRL